MAEWVKASCICSGRVGFSCTDIRVSPEQVYAKFVWSKRAGTAQTNLKKAGMVWSVGSLVQGPTV